MHWPGVAVRMIVMTHTTGTVRLTYNDAEADVNPRRGGHF